MTQPPAPPPSRTPSHLLPFVFGCVALFLANLGAGAYRVLQADTSTSDAEHLGEFVGVFAVLLVVVGLAWAVTRLLERPPRFAVVTFFTLGVILLVQLGSALVPLIRATTFTPAERAGLVVTADSISHPTLGFWAPNPNGAFTTSAELQRRLDSSFASHTELIAWGLNSAGHGNVIIEVAKFSGMGEAQFRAYVRGLRREAVRRADAIFEDTVTWTTRGEYRLGMRVRTAFLRSRCLSRAGDQNLIVCLQAASADSTGLGAVPAGLTLKE